MYRIYIDNLGALIKRIPSTSCRIHSSRSLTSTTLNTPMIRCPGCEKDFTHHGHSQHISKTHRRCQNLRWSQKTQTVFRPVHAASSLAAVHTASSLAPVLNAPSLAPVLNAPSLAPVLNAPSLAPVLNAPSLAPVLNAPSLAPVLNAPSLAPVL